MTREVNWLHAELPGLVDRGVLTSEAAEALRRHYGPPDPVGARTQWGQIILAAFGAVLVGGGTILILAHNWPQLGRPIRAAIAFGLLLAAQGLALYVAVRQTRSAPWIEASSGLLVVAVGASMALIGQTYHAGGSFEALMRTWLWLVAPIPYLTGSILASIGFWLLLVVRATAESWRGAALDLWPLVLTGVPFVVLRIRRAPGTWSTAVLVAVASVSVFVAGSIASVESTWRGLWAVFQVSFLSALLAAAAWPPGREAGEPWRGRILHLAWFSLIVVATILGFREVWPSAAAIAPSFRELHAILSALVAVACAAFASAYAVRLAGARRFASASGAAAGVVVVVAHLATISGVSVGWVLFNLWLLATGSLTLTEGIREGRLGTANRGLLALAALVLARFFDTDLSFLVRGLAFVALGVACFALNYGLLSRARRGVS